MEISTIPRAPSSLPILQDNRSDISMTSRATNSTSARYYARNSKGGGFQTSQKVGSMGIVCANFGLNEIDESDYLTARGLTQTESEGSSGYTTQRSVSSSGSDKPKKKKRVSFSYTPSMLLPKAHPKSQLEQSSEESFLSYVANLRRGSVVPHDPDKLPIIIGPNSFSQHYQDSSPQRPNSANSFSSSLSDISSKDDDDVFDNGTPFENAEEGEYLDNFAENDVAKYRWALLRTKLKRSRRKKSSKGSSNDTDTTISDSHEDECPICAKASKQLGGQDALMTWIVNKFGPRKDVYPKFNNISRGNIPHFCNFVKKVRLKEKEFERPQADHTHLHHHSTDDTEGIPQDVSSKPVELGSSQGSSLDRGTGGQPSSPVSDTDNAGWPQVVEEECLSDDSIDIIINHRPVTPEDDASKISIPTASPCPTLPVESNARFYIKSPQVTEQSEPKTKDGDLLDKRLSGLLSQDTDDQWNSQKGGQVNKNNTDNDDQNNKLNNDDNSQPSNTTTSTTTTSAPLPKPPTRQLIAPPLPTKPEPAQPSPFPHQNLPPSKKPRAPIQKKEKKPFERKRQEKEEAKEEEVKMEEKETEPQVVEEVKSPEPPPKPKLEAKVPDLPSVRELNSRKSKGLGSKRGGREGIRFMSPFDDPNTDKETLDKLKEQRKAFELNVPEMSRDENGVAKSKRRPKSHWLKEEEDDCSMESLQKFIQQEMNKKPKVNSWLTGRLALSQQSSRFELPMDMKTLESMSGEDYLKKHCVISQRRQALYQKVHNKYRSRTGTISVKELEKALQEVLVNSITPADIELICSIVGLTDESVVDYKLFAGLAAMAERILYPKFITDDTADLKEFQKETIECADFSALDWKLHGLRVNPQVKTILKTL